MSSTTSFRAVRWVRTLNLLAQAVLFITLFGGLNYLAVHYAWRFDLTQSHRHSLSPETLAYLQGKTRRSFKESLALAALFAAGDNGQAVIRTIKEDGLERVDQLNDGTIRFYQFLPLYDVIHLGNVLRRGQAPTSGEMAWALIDGCFVVADALSLAALQPEGAVASEAARSEIKSATREAVKAMVVLLYWTLLRIILTTTRGCPPVLPKLIYQTLTICHHQQPLII